MWARRRREHTESISHRDTETLRKESLCVFVSLWLNTSVSSDPAIRLLRDLVAINSVNPTLVAGAPGEQQIADAIAAEMRRLGLDVSIEVVAPGRPNVVGVLE